MLLAPSPNLDTRDKRRKVKWGESKEELNGLLEGENHGSTERGLKEFDENVVTGLNSTRMGSPGPKN